MSDKNSAVEVALGDFQGYGAEFFLQQRIDQSKSGFEVTLPGRVVRCAGASIFGYKDAAVVINDEGAGRRAAWLGSDVGDTGSLVKAVYDIAREVGVEAIDDFAVLLRTETPIGDLLDRLQAKGGGCGCGGEGAGVVRVPGSLQVGFAGKKGPMAWSEPVAAALEASEFDVSATREGKEDCVAISVGPNATACYGSRRMTWNGWLPEFHTVCVGRCSSGECCIRRTKGGTCVQTASGWHSCSCI